MKHKRRLMTHDDLLAEWLRAEARRLTTIARHMRVEARNLTHPAKPPATAKPLRPDFRSLEEIVGDEDDGR